MKPLYQEIASLLIAYQNCQESGNTLWLEKHRERLDDIARNLLPSGSGIDCGTTIDESSRPDRLVLSFSYHHMDEGGYYDGWTEHTAIVTPSLAFGADIRITGKDRNQIKDYLHDVFHHCLTSCDWALA